MKAEVNEADQSDFNSGIATLRRIDELKRWLIKATVWEDYMLKWRVLKAFYLELVSQTNNKDDGLMRNEFIKTRNKYNEFVKLKKAGTRFIPISLIDAIDDLEIYLKNMEQSYGLNMPKKEDARFAMATGYKRR